MTTKKIIAKKKTYFKWCLLLLSGVSVYLVLSFVALNTVVTHQQDVQVCLLKTAIDCEQVVQVHKQEEEVWLTIFIHGIMSIKNHITLFNVIKLMQDAVENTVYSTTIALMRDNDFFFKNQAMQACGLKNIDLALSSEKSYAAGALACLFDSVLKKSYPQKNFYNQFYTFGWSGVISHKERVRAGKELYDALTEEVLLFKSKNIIPKIRIVGYSHGGNVALNVASMHEKDKRDHPFFIDELILIGTPIQCETDHLIESSLFRHVYNIYSKEDRIQTLDFFSYKRFFSKRTLSINLDDNALSKLTQVEIKVTSPAKKQSESMYACPIISQSVLLGKSNFLRNKSPGHSELWFFGWTPSNYRQDFPLYPFPVIAFVPYILKQLQHYAQECPLGAEDVFVADIRPEYEHVILRSSKDDQRYMIAPFFSDVELIQFHNNIRHYIPENYTKELHDQLGKDAYKKAYEFMQSQKS